MKITLSDRVNAVKPSPTLAITARAAQLRSSGKDIISLGAGEPDFDTPEHIKKAAIKALAEGFTKYPPVDGTPSLKSAIIPFIAKIPLRIGYDNEFRNFLLTNPKKKANKASSHILSYLNLVSIVNCNSKFLTFFWV